MLAYLQKRWCQIVEKYAASQTFDTLHDGQIVLCK